MQEYNHKFYEVWQRFNLCYSFLGYSEEGLTSLVLYFHNKEPLGTYFKTVACYVTGTLHFIEIQIEKEGMKKINLYLNLWEMVWD